MFCTAQKNLHKENPQLGYNMCDHLALVCMTLFYYHFLYFHVSDVSVKEDDGEVDLSVLEDVVEGLESGDRVSFLRELVERKVDTTLPHKPDKREYHPVVDALFKSVEDAEALASDPT